MDWIKKVAFSFSGRWSHIAAALHFMECKQGAMLSLFFKMLNMKIKLPGFLINQGGFLLWHYHLSCLFFQNISIIPAGTKGSIHIF